MRYFKKFLTLFIVSSLAASRAYAIDIEPEHDAIVEQKELTIKPVSVPVPKVISNQEKTNVVPQVLPHLANTTIDKPLPVPSSVPSGVSVGVPSSVPSANSFANTEQRIYYARSITSNNPEYKTRFSILHNTPSPKRIAGERLYNLSDSFFRLSVVGNDIHILDNPIFHLTGINSATGRYGEIKILDNAVLKIHTTSKRFKGNWDVDGTGARNLKVTPTNLVSGTVPVHIKTFNRDGSVVTDETHQLNFKALAMGPYNGYWSDGVDIGIFLWGMSSLKLKSQEMAYLGLDLGIVTEKAPETTGATAEDTTLLPSTVIAPLESGSGNNNNTASIAPFGGNNGNSFGGFGGFGGGFGGGGGGGNVCLTNPNLPGCRPVCVENPTSPGCRPVCVENPTSPGCRPVCVENPTSPECKPVCIENPTLPGCRPVCVENPTLPGCRPVCVENPTLPGCRPVCVENPTLPQCQIDFCIKNPKAPQCQEDFCTKNPKAPQCQYCVKYPDAPQCQTDVCVKYPDTPQCQYCVKYPDAPKCQEDFCTKNPTAPQCNPVTPSPVSEPFLPLVYLSVLVGYCITRRKSRVA